MSIARYSFFPWLRRGIANRLASSATAARASVDVTLTVASEVESVTLPSRSVQLVGPGDVIGINPQAIVRTEPRSGATNFEPNYLAHVEFYDEDFCWRYTPAMPDTTQHRLIPWISLLILKEGEFTRDSSPTRPLPSITLKDVAAAQVLPPESQLSAWAHVHLNESFGSSRTPDLNALGAVLSANPDLAYSRLVSPRRLVPNTSYRGFVIPTFEVGRKAGLGAPVADSDPGLAIAWSAATEFPVYFEWSFRTGSAGDFESLVRALKPRAIDPRVGIRDLDVQQPGFMLPPISSPPEDVVGLEGAILSPTSQHDPLHPGSNFFPEIERVVNLAAEAETGGVGAEDPVVTAPLYGQWHALVRRISADPAQRNWVNELNVDPRMRAVAGFGTRVIQKNQEEYMRLAWQQIGDVLAANRRIHFVQYALQASQRVYERHVLPLGDERVLAFSAPVFGKVRGSPVTVRYLLERSAVPRAAVSGAFRKQLRPRGALARRVFTRTPSLKRTGLAQAVRELNTGKISAAPPRTPPQGPTLEGVLDVPTAAPSEWMTTLTQHRRLLFLIVLIVCALMLLIAPTLAGLLLAVTASAAAYYVMRQLGRKSETQRASAALAPQALTVEAVRAIPPQPQFVLARTVGREAPVAPAGASEPATRRADSSEARDFRTALLDFHALLTVRPDPPPAREALPLDEVRTKVLRAIEPARAFSARIAPLLRIGERPLGSYVGTYRDDPARGATPRVVPVMAYPDIRKAMYEPLCAISNELLVPNLKLIEANTISLMVRNQPFIEAYMAGLNCEFARELLWREYPTDQRPSSFRQFWDVSQVANVRNLDPKAFEESLRDVTRIHEWAPTSKLGEHNNRAAAGDPAEGADTPLLKRPVVLVIRGDLLKRYPNTVIYAQRARWGTRADNALRLILWDETGEKSENDPAEPNIRYPQYKAQVSPDIHFVGFDLSVEEVRGDPALEETAQAKASLPGNKLGWFFVLKEVVGEPRFGLDEEIPEAPAPVVWDNLAWQNLGADVKVIDVGKPFALAPGGSDHANVAWGANSADMAFILYQKPVLVAVHAREMLRNVGV